MLQRRCRLRRHRIVKIVRSVAAPSSPLPFPNPSQPPLPNHLTPPPQPISPLSPTPPPPPPPYPCTRATQQFSLSLWESRDMKRLKVGDGLSRQYYLANQDAVQQSNASFWTGIKCVTAVMRLRNLKQPRLR
ncbi:hypothetical protein C7M84_000041 [Penaeus vannamei]|uniref:Uncharacterized protein n=1 Tax=Penaeus vannamei TaxID=6689 RepID=A0A423TXP4_PENVA|nr:hypothetical protein C7M84_000041 [Penaeus vannamei]